MADARCKFWDVKKHREFPGRCVRQVSDHTGFHFFQCSRKRGHGPDELYCKQHAQQIERRKKA